MIRDILNSNPAPLVDFNDKLTLIANLAFLHGIMTASEGLLEEALKYQLPDNLADYYAKHLEEERNHAFWMAEDLRFLGHEPELNWNAAQIAGTQYYLIKHTSRTALLGYMAALECRPMPMAHIEAIEALHGKEAMRCLRYHAEHDIEHGQDLLDLIEEFDDKDMIYKNCAWTAITLNQAIVAELGEQNG